MSKIARKLLVGFAATGVCLSMFTGMAFAEEDKPTAELSVAALSQYVWRGFALSKDSIVVQPSATIGYKGFSFNLWGNMDTDLWNKDDANRPSSWTETDMTMSYAWAMGPVSFSAGYIYYAVDNSANNTQELFLSATLDTLLKPTLKVYRDIDHFPGWYATLGVSHSVPVTGEINLDLGAQVGYLAADEASSYADPSDSSKAYGNFHDGVLSASMKIPVNKYIAVTPQLYYSFPLSSDAKDRLKADNLGAIAKNDADFVYGGVALSMAF